MKTNTCLVIDTWEGQAEIDEAVLKANGVVGMGIRLNDMNGGHHPDTNFQNQWKQAEGFARFPYFVYNPWKDGTENFNWLLNHSGIPVEVKTIAVDIEVKYGSKTPLAYSADVKVFLSLCKPHWKVIIYTGQWFLPYLSSWPTNYDYWLAQYPLNDIYFPNVTTWDALKVALDNPKLALPFNSSYVPGVLKMWQFSGDTLILPGNAKVMDINLFYGTPDECRAYFNNTPIPVPDPIVKINTVKAAGVLIPFVVTVDYEINGVEHVASIDQRPPVVVPPPPPPAPVPDPAVIVDSFVVPNNGGDYRRIYNDWLNPQWMDSRVIIKNYKESGVWGWLPQTAILYNLKDQFHPLSEPWQRFWFELIKLASGHSFTEDVYVSKWESLTADSRAFTDNHAVQNGFHDFITGANPNGKPIALKSLSTGGNLVKVVSIEGTRLRIECLDVSKAPPDPAEVWMKKPWLYQLATQIGGIKLADKTYRTIMFPQLKPYPSPVPVVSSDGSGTQLILKTMCSPSLSPGKYRICNG